MAEDIDPETAISPWLDPNRDPSLLVKKTESILELEENIRKCEEGIEVAKEEEEGLRHEYQLHRQHADQCELYIKKRMGQLHDPWSKSQEILHKLIPQMNDEAKRTETNRVYKTDLLEDLVHKTYNYNLCHDGFLNLRLHSWVSQMSSYQDRVENEIAKKVNSIDTDYANLKELCKVKLELHQHCPVSDIEFAH